MALQRRDGHLLTRLLEEPALVALVQGLEGAALGRLIDHVGLEDAGEIVALATTAQLEEIFDHDLWRSRSVGQDESFDPARFALWLEILLEAGEELTARKLSELDEDLLTMAISKEVLVLEIDGLEAEILGSEDPGLADKALESSLSFELDRYQLVARHPESWDPVLTALVALDRDHHELLGQILERCAFQSSEYIADNGGLYQVLTSSEMLESDVAGAREDRRSQAGYVAPSSATAFLRWAEITAVAEIIGGAPDPTTRAYFRSYAPRASKPSAAPRPADRGVAVLLEELQAGDPEAPRKKLASGRAERPVERAMGALRASDAARYEQQLRELNYLANVLISGCNVRGRPLRPVEAGEAVLAVVEAGMVELGAAAVGEHGVVKVFAVGWKIGRPEGIETAKR
jgi:hypothetical protein